jgi:hypothetical protein
MKKQGFAETLASKDYYVGCYDELEIEEGLYRLRKSGDRSGLESAEAEAMRAALREIDRLKISGDYEVERVLLRKRYESKPRLTDWKLDSAFSKYWENFRAGMKSTDLDQRARFLAFYHAAQLGRMLPTEIVDLIAVLEPAKRKNGRPGVSLPWSNIAWALDEMRPLVAGGASIPSAARQVAAIEAAPQEENRAKRYEKLFRDRLRIRE